MDLNELKNTLASLYKQSGQSYWSDEDSQLILTPSANVWDGMIKRNPSVVPEVKKINSSTALAINYFQLFAESKKICVDYEVDVAIPLVLGPGKGHSAMIDVKYNLDNKSYFVESKFLEPYYSSTHEISPSYFIEQYYVNANIASKWIAAFKDVHVKIQNGEFLYFDINQMLKHLLAIHRTQPSGPVVLKNLIWKPTASFFKAIKSQRSASYLNKRCDKLDHEMKLAEDLLNQLVAELNWKDCLVEVKYYNDELKEVQNHNSYKVFKDKYML